MDEETESQTGQVISRVPQQVNCRDKIQMVCLALSPFSSPIFWPDAADHSQVFTQKRRPKSRISHSETLILD